MSTVFTDTNLNNIPVRGEKKEKAYAKKSD